MNISRGAVMPDHFTAPRGRTLDEVIADAEALDFRRQRQINLQRDTINHLLRNGGDLASINDALTKRVAELEARQQAVIDDLITASRKPSPVARRVLAVLDPQEKHYTL